MRQMLKRSLALFMAIVMCFGLVHITVGTAHAADESMIWTKVELGDIQSTDTVAITMTKGSSTWALYNGNGTGSAPTAVVVTVDGTTMTCTAKSNDSISWNITNNAGSLIIYKAGSTSTWLYTTNKNNGTRVGTNSAKTWKVDSASGYLMHTDTSRYLGVYETNPDWRAYTNTTGNTAGQTLSFWKLVPAGCEHEWAEATCTAPKTCTLCEETEGDPLGHDWVEAACTTPKTCNRCHVTEGDPLGHSYDEEGVCTVCGAMEGCTHEHTEVLPGEPATCTKDGLSAGEECVDCHEILVAQEVIPATGHSYESVVTAPTCTDGGYTTYTCSVCSDSYTADETAALGHDYENGICTVCDDIEPVAKTLTFDDASKRTEYSTTKQVWQENGITVTNNKSASQTNVNNSVKPVRLYAGSSVTIDCLDMAKIVFTCNSSDYAAALQGSITSGDVTANGKVVTLVLTEVVDTYTIAKLSAQVRMDSITVYAKPCQHTNTEALEAVAPTCTETGLTEGSKCADCGEIVKAQEVVEALGHKYDAVVTAPTCTEGGYTTYTCTVCGDSYTDDETSATGHTYVEGVCKDCGAEENCAHTNTQVLPAVAPTCTETGLTEGSKCTACDEIVKAQEVVEALGHAYGDGVVTAPTCTEGGYTTYTCTNDNCGHSYTDNAVAATGHDWENGECAVCHIVQVSYVYASNGKYIYNWGTREVEATFLSPKAETFYSGQNTYEYFSELAGGTGTADAPSSELYKALKSFMSSQQTWTTSYDDTRNLYQYTDCENSGNPKTISAFYSGSPIGPAWDSGSTWNREHVWPNSKGDASGQGENDIMMLRPAVASNNSSRGNKAYGESSSFYHPNSESNGKHDLRGDVSRIVLYVYTRWGNTGSMWGSNGVIESLDVLLKWIEEDPVDTWELGRNDSVQSMTGTRNVFVDYPELAFLLFGAEIPEDMTTPSGEAKNTVTCEHNYVAGTPVAPTCTTEGYTVYTCTLCSRSYSSDKVPATGHNFENGACINPGCDEVEPESQSVKIYYPAGSSYITTTNAPYNGQGRLAAGTAAEAAVWVMTSDEQGYVTFFADGKYLTSGASGNELYLSAELTDCGWWEIVATDGGVLLRNVGANYSGNYNQHIEFYKDVFTVYGLKNTSDKSIFTFVLQPVGGSDECQHSWKDATCTAPKTCPLCGATEGEALGHDWKDADCTTPKTCEVCGATEGSALGHNYVDGACTVCGEAKPSGTQATINFDDLSKRTEISDDKQVWVENGITVTNNKAASANPVNGQYYNPIRLYQGTSLTIEYPGMTKIEFTCNTYKDYTSTLKNSVTDGTVTISGNVVTITLDAAVDTYSIAGFAGQVRVDSITIYAADTGSGEGGGEENPCQHDWKNATCTEPKTCKICGQTEGEALGHNYFGGTCTRCGAVEAGGHSHSFTHTVISVPTCESAGITLYSCNDCFYSYTVATKAAGHKFVDGTCTVCGKVILEDGSSVTITDESVEVIVSKDAVSSEEDVVVLPIPEITVSTSETAPTVTIDVSDIETDAAVKVEIPVADVTESTVVVIVHEDGTEEIMQKTAVTENGLAFEMEGNVTVKVVDNAKEFEDVSDDSWSSEAVNFTTSREILGAADDGKFAPKNNMTCIQLTTLLFSMDNKSSNLSNDELEVKAIEWAEANQIVNSAFQGEKALTREQLVDFIYRYVGAPKLASNTGRFAKFTDCDTVSSWARDAMIWAVEEGVINGMGDDTLNPTGKATREQVAQVLMNLINKQ